MGDPQSSTRPSLIWLGIAIPTLAAAIVFAGAAITHQRGATKPIGEGELFQSDAAAVLDSIPPGTSVDELRIAVRRIRNRLEIEAVSVLDSGGTFIASTSEGLVGEQLGPGLLSFAMQNGALGALARAIDRPVEIDGVEEWASGDTLYEVLQPLPDGGGVLLYYDLAELLQRRATGSGVQTTTVQLGAIAVALMLAGIGLVAGRRVATKRIGDAAREAEMLEARSRELEIHNVELEAARTEAERALALAEETNRIRSEFVLMINHELRTPLTGVVTGAELLLDGSVPPAETGELVADMVRNGRRLGELIGQILNVARIENRGLQYELRDVGLSEVLRRVAKRASARVDQESSLEGIVILSDPDPLAQLIISLADNALSHGAASVHIRTAPTLEFEPALLVGEVPASAVYVLVEDDGPGIDPGFLPRAFEKFEKQSFDSGTGLGLYLARMMIEAIRGCIAVKTGPGGTTMAVGVPLVALGEARKAS